MSNTIVLVYTATATSNTRPANLETAMRNVALYQPPVAPNSTDPVLGQLLGLTVATDVTTVLGSVAERTITLNMDYTAGAPTAPPFFPVSPQTADNQACIYSTSPKDTVGDVGAQTVSVSYLDAEGNAGTVSVNLAGPTPVTIPLAGGTKGVASVTAMSITAAGSFKNSLGQITVAVFTPLTAAQLSAIPKDRQQSALQGQIGVALAMLPASYYSAATYPIPAVTTIAQPSNGAQLPQPVLVVDSVSGFPASGNLSVETSNGTQTVAYTGVSDGPMGGTFTGCSGGTGTVLTGDEVLAVPMAGPNPAILVASLTNFFTSQLALALAAPVTAALPVLV